MSFTKSDKVLLSFAHRGEAQAFLNDTHWGWHHHPQFNFIFQSPQYDLILTGEGVFEALHRLSLWLGQSSYQKMINLGIAGSLSERAQLGAIYAVRTCYLFHQDQMKFHSFLQADGELDCVTHFERVIETKNKRPLEGFAHLVDRELWSLAKACQSFDLPWQSYKLITDKADESTLCQSIAESSLQWSQQLRSYFDHWLSQKPSQPIELLTQPKIKNWTESWLTHPDLHWTGALKQEFKNLVQQNPHLENTLKENPEVAAVLSNKAMTAKTRVIVLLDILRSLGNPILFQYKQKRLSYQKLGQQQGIEIQFDPKGENLELVFKFSTSNQKGLNRKIQALQQISQRQSLDEMQNLPEGLE